MLKHEFHTSADARNAAFMRQQTPEPQNGAQNNCRVRDRFTFLPDESGVPLQFQLNRSGLTWKKGEIRVKRFLAVFSGIEIVNVVSLAAPEARLVDGSFLPHPSPSPCWFLHASSEVGRYEKVMSISFSPIMIFSTRASAILRLSSVGKVGQRS